MGHLKDPDGVLDHAHGGDVHVVHEVGDISDARSSQRPYKEGTGNHGLTLLASLFYHDQSHPLSGGLKGNNANV